jgi:hypothetical protein
MDAGSNGQEKVPNGFLSFLTLVLFLAAAYVWLKPVQAKYKTDQYELDKSVQEMRDSADRLRRLSR